MFNWTLLILEKTGSNIYMIESTYVIQSLGSTDMGGSANCAASGGEVTCCDTTNVERFDLPMNNFFVGVTESAQGNSHNAALLRISSFYTQYLVDTIEVSKTTQMGNLSVGSTIEPTVPIDRRGLHLLWFVIGKHQQLLCVPVHTDLSIKDTARGPQKNHFPYSFNTLRTSEKRTTSK